MKNFLCGALSFDRASIPEELKELSRWPTVDFTAFDETSREEYLRREQAIRLFIEEPLLSVSQIEQRTGLHRPQIYRLVQRCFVRHADGRIFGLRGLIRFKRVRHYIRHKAVASRGDGNRRGAAGAFAQLLDRYPSLENFLRKEAHRRGKAIKTVREVRHHLRRLHKVFLDKCRELGIPGDHYPFNQDMLGIRSLAQHLKRLRSLAPEPRTKAMMPKAGASNSTTAYAKPPITTPFQAVEFDGHKIDARLTVAVQDPFGLELTLELQ